MPKVSVILSSYNHEKYIAASIESVLNQTFTDFELLICDDGSTDNSREIIKTFADERIKLFLYEENRGAYFAISDAFNSMTGKYFALHHSDDIWENTKLEKQVQFMEKNPQYEVCFTQVKFIDERGEIYNLPENHPYKNVFNQENRSREEWLNHLFWKSNCFCNPGLLLRNARKNFLMNPSLAQLPDYFMWINLCLKKNPYVLQEELIKFRLRRESQNSVSSISLEKNIRISNELYYVAQSFLPILHDEKFFLKVFPEAKEFLIKGKISVEFAFAQLCLQRKLPAFQKLALEILYDLLHNENKRRLIKKLYGYTEKNFIDDTSKIDVFGMRAQLPILNCRLYIDFGEGYSEEDSITLPTLIRADGNFTATFNFRAGKKITKFRFDPDDRAALSIKIIKASVNGEIVENLTANAFQVVDGYFNFVTADPFFTIDKEIYAENVCVEIFGNVHNDALTNFEKKYNETCATVREKVSQVQQMENSLQEKISQVQQLENSVQEKVSQIQQLENSLQEKVSQIQQLENSVQEKVSQIQQMENSLQEKVSRIRQLENSISAQNQEISLKTQQIKSQADEIYSLQILNTEILNSNSWKLTKPLRDVGKFFRNHR